MLHSHPCGAEGFPPPLLFCDCCLCRGCVCCLCCLIMCVCMPVCVLKNQVLHLASSGCNRWGTGGSAAGPAAGVAPMCRAVGSGCTAARTQWAAEIDPHGACHVLLHVCEGGREGGGGLSVNREQPDGYHGARGVVVSHPLSMREALGSIPSVSMQRLTCHPRAPVHTWPGLPCSPPDR